MAISSKASTIPSRGCSPPGLLHAWVAVLDDVVVGHAVVTEPKPGDAAVDAWIAQGGDRDRTVVGGRLFVHPHACGHDLGAQLAQALTDWAVNHSRRLVGDVMTKDLAAINIYERIGWLRTGDAMHDTGHGNKVPAYLYISPPVATRP